MVASDDVNTEKFSVVRRGYDMSEVESFLESRERDWEAKLTTAQSKIGELEAALAEARSKEEAVHLTLMAATKTKDELLAAAQRKLDEATSEAQEVAEKLLSDARFQAFQLVNDAKENADAALAEARAEAKNVVEAARASAAEELRQIEDEKRHLVESQRRELDELRRKFEEENGDTMRRLTQLASLTLDLETRLKAIAEGSLDEIVELASTVRSTVDVPMPFPTPAPPRRQAQPADQAQPDRRRAIEPPPLHPQESSTAQVEEDHHEEEGDQRGSFYSRRSARLPRIGNDAATGVLAAVSAMRARVIDDDEELEVEDDEVSSEASDMAVQTA